MEQGSAQTTHFVNFNPFNPIRSMRCGTHAAAKLCTGNTGLQPVDGQDENKVDCLGNSEETVYYASSEHAAINERQSATLIINRQPWIAKGPEYLALSRSEKSAILWDKIRADEQMSTDNSASVFQ